MSPREVDEWVFDRFVAARLWYAALPWYSRAWLRCTWWLDPIVCRVKCFLTGEKCPWE